MSEKKKWDPRIQDWVLEYEALPQKVKRTPAQVFVRLAVPIVAAAVVVTGVSVLVAGEGNPGGDPPARGESRFDSGQAGPSPAAPTENAYDAERVALGLAQAIAHVVATVEDPEEGLPRVQAIGQDAQRQTGCRVVGTDVNAASTKAEARELVDGYTELAGTGVAFERVEYAEPDWDDKFVVIAITVVCE